MIDALKYLKLEITGARGTIQDYTSESNVINMLSKLEEGISMSDVEAIRYCLN